MVLGSENRLSKWEQESTLLTDGTRPLKMAQTSWGSIWLSWSGVGSTPSIWHKQRTCWNTKSAVPEFVMVSSMRSGHQQSCSETVWLIKLLHLVPLHLLLGSLQMSRKFDCVPPVSRPSSADCRWRKAQLPGKGWHHLAMKSESPQSAQAHIWTIWAAIISFIKLGVINMFHIGWETNGCKLQHKRGGDRNIYQWETQRQAPWWAVFLLDKMYVFIA